MRKFITACMVVFMATMTSVAQNSGTEGSIAWTFDPSTETLTISRESENGEMEAYNGVPYNRPWASLPYKKVVIQEGVSNIGERAFFNSGITSITIPSTVKVIETDAFSNCPNIKSIELPVGVTQIKSGAFSGCSMESISLPSGLTEIGVSAFGGCPNLKSIVIPFGVTQIDFLTFSGSGLTSIVIPSSVTSIKAAAFQSCHKLASVEIPSSVTEIDNNAFIHCWNLSSVVIPSSLTSIGDRIFSGCEKLSSVVISPGLNFIGDYMFSGCESLSSVVIPPGIVSIGKQAFSGCSLTSIVIPASVKNIANDAFDIGLSYISVDAGNSDYSSLNGVLYNKEKTELIQYPAGRKEATYTIPASVTTIKEEAFHHEAFDYLKRIKVEATIPPVIENGTSFLRSDIQVDIPRGKEVERAYQRADVWRNLGINYLGDISWTYDPSGKRLSITGTGYMPDYQTDYRTPWREHNGEIESVIVNSGVTNIGKNAFSACWNMKSVVVPASVTNIGETAFGSNLREITVSWDQPIGISSVAVQGLTLSNIVLKVPTGREAAYLSAPVWKDFKIQRPEEKLEATFVKADNLIGDGSGAKELKVTSNLQQWKATVSADWLYFPFGDGQSSITLNGNYTLPVKAKPNPDKTERTAKIILQTRDGKVLKEVVVTQNGKTDKVIKVLYLINDDSQVYINGDRTTYKIKTRIYPEDATNKTLKWTSSNPFVASVDNEGLVTIHKKGKAVITIETTDGSNHISSSTITVISTVGNALIPDGACIYTTVGRLHLTLPRAEKVYIYRMTGELVCSLYTAAGYTSVALPSGIYLVKVGMKTEKLYVE